MPVLDQSVARQVGLEDADAFGYFIHYCELRVLG